MSELARKLIAENVAKWERGEDASYLDLGRCGLAELPEELGQCTWVEVLVLSNEWDEWEAEAGVLETQHSQNQGEANRLYKLDGVERLEKLNKLFSGGGIMNSWPLHDLGPLAKLQNLQSLDCRLTEVQDLSPLAALQNLQFLNCSHTKVQYLNSLSGLRNLQVLECRNKQVQDLSPLSNLDNLRSLNCSDTQIKDLSLVSNMKKLQSLSFWKTQVQDLSPLSTLKNLRSLYCHMTQVADLSPLAGLQKLQALNCSSTQVHDLSPLTGLQNLQWLYCGSIQVQDISPLTNLNHLTTLNLSSNQISNLTPILSLIKKGLPVTLEDPPTLFFKKREYGIHLHNNPLTTPPPEIVQQGNTAILQYFEERERKQQFQNTEIKLILIGNSTVGKTSLSRYLRERVYAKGQPSTHGIHNYRWAPEGRKLEVNIWDFGGQEYYHATHRLFLSRNSVYALVWDAKTDAGGYGDTDIHYEHDPVPQRVRLEHFPHRWWLHNIRHYTRESNPPVPVLLVQNKSARDGIRRVSSDLEAAPYSLQPEWLDNHIDLAALAEDMPEAEGRKWARRFEEFEERLLDKLEAQLTHYEFAIYHRDIRDEVRRLAAAGVNDMPYAEFEALCQSFDEEAKMDLVRIYLHDITGDILYYPDHPRLSKRVFLRPDLVCNRIYQILSREVLAQQGLFGLDWVQQALQCGVEEARDFVELMREFELIFDDSDEEGLPTGQYVAPQYLPDACPKPDKLEAAKDYANLTHAFTLWFPDFLPKSHIARFVAYWGSQAQQRLFWKNGLLFRTADCAALVERSEGKQIRVDIQAGQPTRAEAMQQIFQSFLKLEDGQAGFAVSMDGADFVDWSAVVEAARTQAQEIACRSTADNRPKYLPLSKFQTLLQPVKMTAKKIFLSYAKADRAYLDAARRHLRPLERQEAIALWDDTQLLPGEAWDAAIRRELAAADIILFLVSADLMATDYIWDTEMKEAMARAARGEVAVVPVIIRSCVWDDAPFARYTPLPEKGAPITDGKWRHEDEAWEKVLKGMKLLLISSKSHDQ